MTTAIDMSIFTIESPFESVAVADFRNRIEHLERLVAVDYHACVGTTERNDWAHRARRVGSTLIHTTCKRATADDWMRRERAIDRSTSLLGKVQS